MKEPLVKVAILDLYDNEPNQGMRCILDLVQSWDRKIRDIPVVYHVHETRYLAEVPGLDYDIYISSGGPGSPFDGEGKLWEKRYFELIDQIWNHNRRQAGRPKHVFFICHSFQMMCRFFKLATVQQRDQRSFGIVPVRKTPAAGSDLVMKDLPEIFYAADFRQFEAVDPNITRFAELDAKILSKEKFRRNPLLELALMAIRVSDEMVGTQFHPEADPVSMLYHFRQPERKQQVLSEYGEERYYEMIEHLEDPANILLTRRNILPNFLKNAIERTYPEAALADVMKAG